MLLNNLLNDIVVSVGFKLFTHCISSKLAWAKYLNPLSYAAVQRRFNKDFIPAKQTIDQFINRTLMVFTIKKQALHTAAIHIWKNTFSEAQSEVRFIRPGFC